ncbi:MAG: hypothetical protein ACYC6B_02005 [Thermoleophilia bacterium]
MGYTQVELEDKLLQMYPEILGNKLNISVTFDDTRNSWVIHLDKSGHSRYAFLDKKDADACMDGLQCIYLGTLISQYIKDLEQEVGIST